MKQCVLSQRVFRSALAVSLTCSMILPVLAGKKNKREETRGSAAVSIENFGKVNDHIYRGGQPKDNNYQQLAALGVKTVLDLRGDSDRSARVNTERAGMRYINLPLEPKHYPQSDAATRFLEIVNNQQNWPVYVHCAGGRHRTGAMIAVYRMTMDHWTVDQAYNEMKQYDFYPTWGHGCYKDYVYDYYREISRQPGRQEPIASAASAQSRARDN